MADDAKPKRVDRNAPQHDKPCQRLPYETPKALFASMLDEAKDG